MARSRHRRTGQLANPSSNPPKRRWLAVSSIGLIAIALASFWAWPKNTTPDGTAPTDEDSDLGEPIAAADLTRLEPDVRNLIEAKALALKPGETNSELLGDLGLAYAANGIWPEARRAFDAAVQLQPSNQYWRLYSAIAAREAGDRLHALTTLQRLVEEKPDFAPAFHRLGHALLEDGDLDGANKAFQQVIRLQPKAAEGYVGLGEVRLQQNMFDQAITLLKHAISIDRTDRVSHFLLGTAYQRSGQQDLAARELQLGQQGKIRYLRDAYSSKLEEYAFTVRARHQRAIRLMSMGQPQQAAKTLVEALKTEPNNVAMINLLAGAYMQTDRKNDAFSLLQRAQQVDSRHSPTHANLAAWYASDEQLDKALEHANMAVELADWVVTGHVTRTSILLRLNRLDDARKALAQGLTVAPRNQALNQMAKQLAKTR